MVRTAESEFCAELLAPCNCIFLFIYFSSFALNCLLFWLYCCCYVQCPWVLWKAPLNKMHCYYYYYYYYCYYYYYYYYYYYICLSFWVASCSWSRFCDCKHLPENKESAIVYVLLCRWKVGSTHSQNFPTDNTGNTQCTDLFIFYRKMRLTVCRALNISNCCRYLFQTFN